MSLDAVFLERRRVGIAKRILTEMPLPASFCAEPLTSE